MTAAALEGWEQAAVAAGVAISEVSDSAAAQEAFDVIDEVWGDGSRIASVGLLVALAHTHNYVAVATADGAVVGVCVAFFHSPDDRALHSHVAAVRPGLAGRGVGLALKLHQREWALGHGAETITWTYDPLIARNAHFNLNRVGASATRFITDLYGPMNDGLNRGEPSDRLMVEWPLLGDLRQQTLIEELPAALEATDDLPVLRQVPASALACSVAVPADIESMRIDHPELASQWRSALRDALPPLLDAGWEISGFRSGTGYILTKGQS